MAVQWTFPGNNDAGREGFNSSGIAIFSGGLVQSFVREVIQNSLDARDLENVPVCLNFSLLNEPKTEYPEILSLLPSMRAAHEAEVKIDASTEEGREFYKSALDTLEAKRSMRILAIHDFNTKGLDGDTRDTGNEAIGGWLGLVKGSGITKKADADSLGSFGQGAKAPFAISGLRTLFYFTRTVFNGELVDRFQGKSILQTMTLPNGDLSMATGYFGEKDKLQPLIGDEIPSWVINERLRVTQDKGTSIFITDPHLPKGEDDLWFEIKVSIIANFYFAIMKNNLSVTLGDRTVLTSETLDEVFESLNLVQAVSVENFSEEIREGIESVLTIHEAKRNPEAFGTSISSTFGEYVWFLRFGDAVQGRNVGIARKSGMLITRSAEFLKVFRHGVKPFDLFICVTDAKGSEVLKSFENPEHNKFQFDRIRDPLKQADYKKKYVIFTNEIRELIKELAGYEITETAKTGDLNDLIGGYLDNESGTQDDEMSRRVRVGKKGKRPSVKGEGATIESIKVPGSGNSGGDDVHKSKGGNNPDQDGEGEAQVERFIGSRILNLRVVPLSKTENNLVPLRIFVSAPHEGKFDLRLFKAGETLNEHVSFRTLEIGPGKGYESYDFKKNERKELLIFVAEDVAQFALEGMLTA